jgi:hypothetical protein
MNLETDQKIYQVFLEESYKAEKCSEERAEKWRYMELRGEYGRISSYSKDKLNLYFNSKKKARKYSHKVNWVLCQNGDYESVFQIPVADYDSAAKAIQAKKKKVYSPQTLEKMKQWGRQLSQHTSKMTVRRVV